MKATNQAGLRIEWWERNSIELVLRLLLWWCLTRYQGQNAPLTAVSEEYNGGRSYLGSTESRVHAD
jgi:hypothetical protein